MKFVKSGAELFVPDNTAEEEAIRRTTHMTVAAHQDDIEIMAYDGIAKCFGKKDKWFLGTVVTDGAGSARKGLYAEYTDEDMKKIRKLEQKKAAFVGEYGALVMLDYTSGESKVPANRQIIEELKDLIILAGPKVIYTHNLADKHDTHVGVALKVIRAIRELPEDIRPDCLYGCEVWRSLDWVIDSEKLFFNAESHANIASSLVELFDSQICGGKRYDMATMGRRLANATYQDSHSTDDSKALIYGMDLTPLIKDESLDPGEYVLGYLDRFRKDVSERIDKLFE